MDRTGDLSGHNHTFHVFFGNGECPATHIGGCGIDAGLAFTMFTTIALDQIVLNELEADSQPES